MYRARYREYPALARGASGAADIVHIPDQALAHLADAFAGTPIAITCHDLMPLLLEQGSPGSRVASWMDLTLLRHSLERMATADRIVTVSETTKGDVVRLLDVDPARISVVPNALHPAYRATVEPEPGDPSLPPGPRVLSVGRVAPYKNLEPLLRALAEPALTGVSLVRVGEPLAGAQRDLAHRLGVLSRTTELGHLEPPELAKVYAACDLLVQPSLYEGFGVPVCEAMACGLPVVCSDGGSLPEVAADAAVVVPLADDDFAGSLAEAIERILSEPDAASTLRQRGSLSR
jgi:glycosyltransferase involved in cell wall biosynthesis